MPLTYRNILILVILYLCTSCISPGEMPSNLPTATSLPAECQSLASQAHVTGNCRFVAESPDHTTTAYVLVEEKRQWGYSTSTVELGNIDVVKVVNKNDPKPAEIYRAIFFSIEAIEWLEDGQLLIWDAHYDLEESPGLVAIYDPQAGGIVRRLKYPLREEFIFWNEPRTAFYSTIFRQIPCSTRMGGYDFARDRELPAFEPFVEPDQYVRVIGSPVWSEDNTQILISISSGTLIGDYPCGDGKIEWNPSSVVMLNLTEDDLQPVLIKGDNDHNYYLQVDSNGQYEIMTEPYVPSYSQCCRGR